MKRMQRIAVLAMAVCLILGTMAVSVFAEGEGYDHKMTVSAGRGSFGSEDTVPASTAEAVTTDPLANKVKIDGKEVSVTTPDDSKYFVTGLRDAGHDSVDGLLTGEISVAGRDEDVELVVAYGLKSDMVQYTVQYIDYSTNTAMPGLPAETHYGAIGQKPVIAYKYADGYLPEAYAATKTLKADPSENVITFWYYPVDAEGNIITITTGGGGAAGAGGAGGAGGAAGTNIGDAGVPLANGPADVVDLDDNQTPLAGDTNGDGVVDEKDIDDSKTPGASPWKTVGIGAGAIAVVAAAAAVIARRRRDYEEEDEEEEI